MPTRPARHGSSSRPATSAEGSADGSRGRQAVLLGAAVDSAHGRPVGQSQPVPVAPEAVELDELQPGLVGEAPVLVVRRVLGAVGQQHERAVAAGVGRLEAASQRRGALVEAGRRLDAQHLRHRLRHGHGVRHPRRRTDVVLQHQQRAVLVADDVEPGDRDPGARHRGTAGEVLLEVRRRVQDVGRQDAVGDAPALGVHVGDEGVERADALRQAVGEELPLPRVEQARDGVGAEGVAARPTEADAPLLQHGVDPAAQLVALRGGRGPLGGIGLVGRAGRVGVVVHPTCLPSDRPSRFPRREVPAGETAGQVIRLISWRGTPSTPPACGPPGPG